MAISFLAPSIILFLFQAKVFAYTSFVLQYVFLNLLYLPIYHQILLTPTLSDLSNVTEIQFNSYNFIYLINALILYGLNAVNNNSKGATAKGASSGVSLKASGKVMSRFSFKSKSLLNNIVSNLDVAQLEDNPARAKVLIANARLCGELLLSQANTIVDTDSGITPQIDINLSSVKSSEFFEKVWGIASELIRKKNIFGSLSFSKKVPNFLLLDQQRITQIILNILASSVRFTDRGPISVSVSWLENTNLADNAIFEPIPYGEEGGLARGSRSHINLSRPENTNQVFILNTNQRRFQDSVPFEMQNSSSAAKSGILKITIADKGPGMSIKEAEDIFDLYPKSRNGEQPRGFNMWMTNQLCQKMNGKMKVYSRPNNGTTYVVCLKAESATAERFGESSALNSTRPSSRKMKALVIDDNPYSIDAVKGYLENSQAEVVGAIRDKNKAVEIYEEELRKGKGVHVIIVNAHNSLSDAQSVCERIRQFENSRNMEPCAIILLAENYVESKIKEVLDPAGNAKVSHFLRAPVNFSELQKLLLAIQANMVVEPSEPFRPKKVLIVDDNTFNLQLLGRILEMNHCEYLQAENGEKAVEIYMQNWKDIVIVFMDCEMPVMNGYDATRNIRKFQQTKKIPKIKILGVTGHVSSDDICKDAGMNGTVTKPFPADDIKQIIIESLREYQES